jgi:c-di-GMP-binding flagellar brake protein YcgR
MKPRRPITQQDTASLFDEAVRDRVLAVLTIQNDNDDWRSFKCRFLERDARRRFFVLDYQAIPGNELPELVPGQYVGVSFRSRSHKVLFTTVMEAKGHYLFDDRSSVPAVRYRWPESVTELQRRSYYRTPIPETMTLLVTFWLGGASARAAAQGSTLQVVTGALSDVSCGGALVRLSDVTALPWSESETLGVELQLPDGKAPLLVNACFRGVRNDPLGQAHAAIQFIGLELTVEGRLALQRLASCVQRLHHSTANAPRRDWNRPPP